MTDAYHANILIIAFIGAEARRMQRTPEEWDARDLLLAAAASGRY